jgi:hypothetical protein
MTIERTAQGTQIVLQGAERSARQAMAAREHDGRGMLRAKKPQRPPGGLFDPPEVPEPELF